MITLQKDFIHRIKSLNHLVLGNKEHHRKVLINSFDMNGHTLGFQPKTQISEPPFMTFEVFVLAGVYERKLVLLLFLVVDQSYLAVQC